MTLPHTSTFTQPGLDDPHGYIVATFHHWGTNWAWEIQFHLTSDPWYTQHFVTTASDDTLTHRTNDLRTELT